MATLPPLDSDCVPVSRFPPAVVLALLMGRAEVATQCIGILSTRKQFIVFLVFAVRP